jgi:hypothetical protein
MTFFDNDDCDLAGIGDTRYSPNMEKDARTIRYETVKATMMNGMMRMVMRQPAVRFALPN